MAVKRIHIAIGALAGAGVAIAAVAGAGLGPSRLSWEGMGHLIKASTQPVIANAPGTPMSFADIFEKVSPAVVSIRVVTKMRVNAPGGFPGGFPFNLVPPGQNPEDGGPPGARGPKQMSAGSGFFISPDGFLLTNNHVIDNADEIKVVLKDGRELKATLVGRDEGTDLAVIRVEGHDFPFVSFENAARPRVGDWVLAVGNPYDLGGTATAGIVSAYNRDIGERFVDYIQIDAPINRGNSGGPTFDTYGRVIGINTAIFSPSGGSVGIGFDIPADIAEGVAKKLMAGQKITRGYIGATIQDLSEDMASAWGLTGRKGALVAGLVPGGPAAKAGLEPEDVVMSVNGHAVTSASEMTREVAKAQAGDTIHIDLFRAGKARVVDVRSGLRPSEKQLALNGGLPGNGDDGDETPGAPPADQKPILGMALTPVTPETRQAYNLPATIRGVLVEGIKVASDAGDKGLKRGDVIVKAGGHDVATPSDVASAVTAWKKTGRTIIPLAVSRGGVMVYVPIKIDG